MRRQGLVWLAAAVLALGAAACFSDPTKSLRGGATRLSLAQNTLTIHTGDSTSVQGLVYDDQGNQLTLTGATWSTTDATVATVRPDTSNPIPGDAYTRGIIKGVTSAGGITTVVLTFGSLTDTVRVTVLPAVFPGTAVVSGTAGADTIIAPPAATVFINAGDTLTVNATGTTVSFNAATSQVLFGPDAGYIVSRSATVIKAMARRGFQGAATITNLTFAGNAATGPIAVASIPTATVSVQHARYRGTIGVAVSAFGANTQVTLTAPAGLTFSAASGLVLGSGNAIVLSASGATLTAISSSAFNGTWMVTGATVGAATVDSLRPADSTHVAVNASNFPGTVANNTGNLLDTIVVKGNGLAKFTTAPAASASVVTVNGVAAFQYRLFADSIKVIAKISGTAAVKISNVIVAGVTIPALQTAGTLTVNTTTGEANEPGNNSTATATPIVPGATAAAPDTVFGAIQSSGDVDDFYSFTTVATTNLKVTLDFVGNGSGAGTNNPDIDVLLCKNTCSLNADFVNTAGGTAANPETFTQAALPAGTYYIYVNGFANAVNPVTYRVRANFQ
ncbi:MAG: pre-peptidase C-terminal domain-containing protein [Gemmatimonadales bacterium]